MPLSDEYILISGLQHLLFCPRQWALIHIERQWQENIFTAQGRLLHEKAHSDESENRPGLHVARGLPLRCERLKISGVADVVEFHQDDAGVLLPGQKGTWRPYPVEYKHGRPKTKDCDRIQLCAQAACLEEMLDCRIETGALFYGTPRRREEVAFTPSSAPKWKTPAPRPISSSTLASSRRLFFCPTARAAPSATSASRK